MVDETAAFGGDHRHTVEAMVCPSLLDHVASEVERDANVMKQVRKARDANVMKQVRKAKEERRFLGKEEAPPKP